MALVVTALAGCSRSDTAAGNGQHTGRARGERPRVVLVVNGTLGDRSFFDSAQRGMQMAEEQLGFEVRTVELGDDPAAWGPGLIDVAAGEDDYDVLVTMTFAMAELLQQVAQHHPQRRFVSMDAAVDSAACVCDNVYSILFRQNEGGYLAGLYAALMTTREEIEGINEARVVATIGGVEVPVVEDFFVGFEQGVRSVGGIEVLNHFLGSFRDPARGKEAALEFFDRRADMVFHAAGGSGLGVIAAAAERGRWVIGVDSSPADILEQGALAGVDRMLTAVVKNIDLALLAALRSHLDGTLEYGSTRSLGLAESAVGLARGGRFDDITPPEIVARLELARQAITDGSLVVESALGASAR